MSKKRLKLVLPIAVLLFLSLITTASTVGTPVVAESSGTSQTLTVYIQSLQSGNDTLSIAADEIDWYQGEEAAQIFAEREPEAAAEIGGLPNDYYIVNDSETLTTYTLEDHASVTLQIHDRTGNLEDLDIQWDEKVTLQQFIDEFSKTDIIDLSQFPYHITVKDGVITSIVQQYVP
jgi:hypothetical protein